MTEFIKNKKIFMMALLTVCFFSIIFSVIEVMVYESAVVANDEFFYVSGFSGLKQRAEYVHELSAGIVTKSKLNQCLEVYKNNATNNALLSCEHIFPEYSLLLQKAYAPVGEEYNYDIAEISDINDFDIRHEKQVQKYLIAGNEPELTNNEVQYAINKAKESCKEIAFDFTDHFYVFERAFSFLNIVMSICMIIIATTIFTQEKRSGMESILCTIEKKQLRKIGLHKLGLCILLSTVLFVIASVVLSVIILFPIGNKGWGTAIQCDLDYYRSILSWNNFEFVCFLLLGSLISIWIITLFSILIAIVTKDNLLSVILVLFTTYLPVLFYKCTDYSMIKHVFAIFPAMNMLPDTYLRSFYSYGVGNVRILQFYFSLMLSIVAAVMCTFFNYKVFRLSLKQKCFLRKAVQNKESKY